MKTACFTPFFHQCVWFSTKTPVGMLHTHTSTLITDLSTNFYSLQSKADIELSRHLGLPETLWF